MFIFASIPMIEKRMLKRRKDYQAYRERVNMLVPGGKWVK
jgi:steroid 5-alpha reductase family enzyme